MGKAPQSFSQFATLYAEMKQELERHVPFVPATARVGNAMAGVGGYAESETRQWIPLYETLENPPQSVLKPLGIYIGGSGHTNREHGTYASNLKTTLENSLDNNAVWRTPMEKTALITLDTPGRASWAVAVTEDFYTQYGVLPLDSTQVLYTQYSGHDWALIHQALCNNSSVQLLDGLNIYAYANALDIRHCDVDCDIHPNVLKMIDLIECALHPNNPRHITTFVAQQTFYTVQDYTTWYNTPLPPQPDIDTGQ